MMSNSKLLYIFFILFIHLCYVYSFNSTHKCSNEQRDALLLYKQNLSTINDSNNYYTHYDRNGYCENLLGSVDHPIMINWNKSIDCCHWNGVTCNNFTWDVISLDLRCGMLQGVVELYTLFSRLPSLEVLDLSYNSLSLVTNNVTNNVNPDLCVLGLANCELTLFSEFLRAMKNLEVLDLAGNNIHGLIPDWAGEVGGNKLVYLDLSHNSITGLSLFQWDGLEHLYLQSNMIRGQFPLSICDMKNLMYLDISNNSFGGIVPQCLGNSRILVSLNVNFNMIGGLFPTTFCNMTHLKYLDMSGNSFYGVIPQCFENITASLLMINLGYNNFNGAIPNVNENCRLSEGLILNNNQLEGDVPKSLLKCQDLKVLDLGHNQLKARFPRWLDFLTKLEVLILKSNYLHGAIETSSRMGFPFSRLKVFDISHNGFVGRLPGEYFENFNAIRDVDKDLNGNLVNISGSSYSIIVPVNQEVDWLGSQVFVIFSLIDLSSNKFEGEIPSVIGSLNSLKVLNLSHNNLSGQIPHELGNLSEMESLDLSWNQFSGEIPQRLAGIKGLAVINLSQNHLEGRIPEGTQFNTFDESSFGGNPELCGFPLFKRCEGMIPAQVDDDKNDVDGIFPWKVIVLGYGCGTMLGLLMGYRMLSTRKPKWFNAIYDAVERMIPIRQKKRKHVNAKKRNQPSNGTYVLSSRRSLYRNNFAA